MDSAAWLGVARHILTALGGVLVTKGYIDETGIEAIIGGVVTIAGVIWSIVEKRSRMA